MQTALFGFGMRPVVFAFSGNATSTTFSALSFRRSIPAFQFVDL
jgi:hypothetical protein